MKIGCLATGAVQRRSGKVRLLPVDLDRHIEVHASIYSL